MNTCIGSSGPEHPWSFAGNSLKRALEMVLNSVAMRLALPAGERRAVVSDDQFQSPWHPG
jgi:hypothetical protein